MSKFGCPKRLSLQDIYAVELRDRVRLLVLESRRLRFDTESKSRVAWQRLEGWTIGGTCAVDSQVTLCQNAATKALVATLGSSPVAKWPRTKGATSLLAF